MDPVRRNLLVAAPLALWTVGGRRAEVKAQDGEPGGRNVRPDARDANGFEERTPASERAVRRGLDWLLKARHRDGGCGVDIGQPADVGCTSLMALALLANGDTPIEGPRSRELRQIAAFLVKTVEAAPEDDVVAAQQTQLQNKIGRHAHTFFAALALSQLAGEGWQIEPVQAALRKLVAAIVAAQTPDGHWGQQAWAPTLGTVMGWVALRAAHFAGLHVGSSPDATARHLARQMSAGAGAAGGGWMHALYKNATGVRVLYALGQDDQPVARQALQDVLKLVAADDTAFSQAGGEEFLAFHLITETLLQKGGADWRNWFPLVRDKIVAVQNADGSWTGAHCITSRTFCTAAATLVLSAPNRYLPISQP